MVFCVNTTPFFTNRNLSKTTGRTSTDAGDAPPRRPWRRSSARSSEAEWRPPGWRPAKWSASSFGFLVLFGLFSSVFVFFCVLFMVWGSCFHWFFSYFERIGSFFCVETRFFEEQIHLFWSLFVFKCFLMFSFVAFWFLLYWSFCVCFPNTQLLWVQSPPVPWWNRPNRSLLGKAFLLVSVW